MSTATQDSLFSLSNLYEMAQNAYSTLPFKYMKNGYAFPPWHYYIEVTRRCNLRCKMCQYIEWLENEPIAVQREGELSTEEWLNVIDQIQRFSLVTFTGGEPFVRKDFMEILSYASKRARTHFISNTTMLPEDRAEAVVELAPKRLGGMGFNFAGTSIEGPGDMHDEIRKLRGAFKKSMAGIAMLRKYRDATGKQCPKIHVTTVLQKDNVHALKDMPKIMHDNGVDVINFVTESRMHELPELGLVNPEIYNTEDLEYPSIDRTTLSEALDEATVEARNVGIELRLPRMPKEDLLNYYSGALDLKNYECRNAWNTLLIGRQGDAFPCWLKKIGNVLESPVKEIWQGAESRDFRQTCQKKLFAACPGCCFLQHKNARQDEHSSVAVAATS
jgi:radical SAM protein with 4Fe4S-binding SPASM domain